MLAVKKIKLIKHHFFDNQDIFSFDYYQISNEIGIEKEAYV